PRSITRTPRRAVIVYLLDTSIVSQPTAAKPNARIMSRLADSQHECAIAAPVWHELRFGWARLPPSPRRAAPDHYLRGVEARRPRSGTHPSERGWRSAAVAHRTPTARSRR